MIPKITELFIEPFQFGLRGNPFFWKDLKVQFEYANIKNLTEFRAFLLAVYEENTGRKPILGKNFGVEHFRFGGMSSGVVSSDFWINKGFPLLEDRCEQLTKYH